MKNKRKRAEPVIEPVDEAEEVAELEQQVVATAPARGTQPFTESSKDRQPFTSLPLSQRTTRGLAGGGFKTMTEIQVRLATARAVLPRKADSPVKVISCHRVLLVTGDDVTNGLGVTTILSLQQ